MCFLWFIKYLISNVINLIVKMKKGTFTKFPDFSVSA